MNTFSGVALAIVLATFAGCLLHSTTEAQCNSCMLDELDWWYWAHAEGGTPGAPSSQEVTQIISHLQRQCAWFFNGPE